MLKWMRSGVFWGILLILGGFLILLDNLTGINLGDLFWVIVLAIGCIFFLALYFQNRMNWWALIPGISLAFLAIVVLLGLINEDMEENWGGVIFLIGIGLSFLTVYLVDHIHWWALIPSGVLISLGVLEGVKVFPVLNQNLNDSGQSGLFLLGLAITFLLVAILPTPVGKMNWAYIPAGILALTGMLLLAFSGTVGTAIGSVLLVFLGVLFIYRAVRK